MTRTEAIEKLKTDDDINTEQWKALGLPFEGWLRWTQIDDDIRAEALQMLRDADYQWPVSA